MRPPRRIWLQWHGDQELEPMETKPEEVTWCEDQIWMHDIEYMRADTIRAAIECLNPEKLERWGMKREAEAVTKLRELSRLNS